MPLNYAHEDPGDDHFVRPPTSAPTNLRPENHRFVQVSDFQPIVGAMGGHVSSSEGFSPWLQCGESENESENKNIMVLGPGYFGIPGNPMSSAAGASLVTTQSDHGNRVDDVDPEMLEIDWVSAFDSYFQVTIILYFQKYYQY
jgi:hypothetical protein